MKLRFVGLVIGLALVGFLHAGCKKAPKANEGPSAGEPDKKPASIREICQKLQKQNRRCEKALLTRVRGLAAKSLNLKPKGWVSLQGPALRQMQQTFIQQWLHHSTREIVRDLYTKDTFFKVCASLLRDARDQSYAKPRNDFIRCGATSDCGAYVTCLDKVGHLTPIRQMFDESNKDRKKDKVEPEGPWKIATFLLGMAVSAELFYCCLPLKSSGKTRQQAPGKVTASSASMAARQAPRRTAGKATAMGASMAARQAPRKTPGKATAMGASMAARQAPRKTAGKQAGPRARPVPPPCLARVGERPRRCAAELMAFAKSYVSKRIPTLPAAEQAVLKKLLATETGADAIKRLQANTASAVGMMHSSKDMPFAKVCGAKGNLPPGLLKHTAPVQAISTCARHAKCKPYVTCLVKMVRK